MLILMLNIFSRINSASDISTRLDANFTNICEYLNRIESTVDNVRTRHGEVTNLVDQTTNSFQGLILDISNKIDDLSKQSKYISLLIYKLLPL